MRRYRAGVAVGHLIAAVVLAQAALAQDYPTRPIRIVIPYAAGGGSDITTRIVTEKAAGVLGQSFVIENRAGGATLIGTHAVATADPDGYTLGVMDPAFVANPALLANARYDPLKDFAPVTLFSTTPLVLVVHPSSPAKTLAELIEHAKKNPGTLNYGSPGTGSAGHLAIEQFRSAFGLQMVHIPYKGAGPAVADMVAGQVSMLMAGTGATPFVKSGQLRALAVTSPQRVPSMPDVPTFAELGYPGVNVQTFAGLVAPVAVPKAAVAKLHAAFAQVLATPEMRARLQEIGQFAVGNTPEQFGAFLRENMTQLGKVVRDANIKVE